MMAYHNKLLFPYYAFNFYDFPLVSKLITLYRVMKKNQ